jgi:group I intron endonuclease
MGDMIENGNYCVYVHTSPSGKKYVGQTKQKPDKRWGNSGAYYLRKKKNGEYGHRYFAHAILKYGWENFEHEIIASNLTKEEADNFEKLLIMKLDTKNPEHGYNLKDGGHGGGFSEEVLKRMSESRKGKKQSEETIRKRFENLRGENHHNYGKPLSEKTKQKVSDSNKGENNHNYGKHFTEEHKKKIRQSLKKQKVAQYDLQENFIRIWDSMGDIERELGIFKGNVSACCRGKAKTTGGFIWKYYEEDSIDESHTWNNGIKVAQYSLSGELISIFQSLKEAEKKIGVNSKTISLCCKGKRKTVGGYIWKYYEDIEKEVI